MTNTDGHVWPDAQVRNAVRMNIMRTRQGLIPIIGLSAYSKVPANWSLIPNFPMLGHANNSRATAVVESKECLSGSHIQRAMRTLVPKLGVPAQNTREPN